jgi:phage portal protein BeeE
LWEQGFALADVTGSDLLDRRSMALIARALGLRGEAVFLIEDDALIAASDWDLKTSQGRPLAYRISISEAGGATTRTALAREVLHFRIGSDIAAPWSGTSPLRRARLTAALLHTLETALGEIYENAPLGTSVLAYPEGNQTDLDRLGKGFRGRRGDTLLRESVQVVAAGGPAPQSDWKPADLTPNIEQSMISQSWTDARSSILASYGVLPAMLDRQTTGPLVRESQRHLFQFTLQPIAALVAEEATAKLGDDVSIDVVGPAHAYDSGARSRGFATIVEGLAAAKAAGLDAREVAAAMAVFGFTTKNEDA